jgi:hypothetical protein
MRLSKLLILRNLSEAANLRKCLGIKLYIKTMPLPREMMRQKNISTVTLTISKVITNQSFTAGMTHLEWAQKVKSMVYSLL